MSAPHHPASNLADVLGLADPATATFTAVLEAKRRASIDTLADVLVLCPAATPGISRLLSSRVRATAAVQNLRADDAAELCASSVGGDGCDGGGVARVPAGPTRPAAPLDTTRMTGGDAGSGTGGPPRGPSGRFMHTPLSATPRSTSSTSAAGDSGTAPDDDAFEVAAAVLVALRAPMRTPGARPAHRA